MKSICIVSCTKNKQNYECNAKIMYSKSTLFKKQIELIEKKYKCDYYILSAKYGLLKPDDIIKPYDKSLYKFNKTEFSDWVKKVYNKLILYENIDDTNIIFFCGNIYRKDIIPYLKHYDEPFKGLGIGNQLKKINEILKGV